MKTPRLVPPHSATDDQSFDALTRALNASIRGLHRVVGNAKDDDKFLVIGDGGVQLIDAALWALTQGKNVNKSMHVFAQAVGRCMHRNAASLAAPVQSSADVAFCPLPALLPPLSLCLGPQPADELE